MSYRVEPPQTPTRSRQAVGFGKRRSGKPRHVVDGDRHAVESGGRAGGLGQEAAAAVGSRVSGAAVGADRAVLEWPGTPRASRCVRPTILKGTSHRRFNVVEQPLLENFLAEPREHFLR